ncbi:MAG: HEAT repeat domain-containing protein [Gemmatimonadaceae bacterium]
MTLSAKCLTVLACIASSGSVPLEAQPLAARIAAIRDGHVRLSFASLPAACGAGNSIRRSGGRSNLWSSNYSGDVTYDQECSHGPVRLVLTKESGRLTRLTTYVGGHWRPASSGTVDLGTVSAREATDFLLFVTSDIGGSIGRAAILPITLADSVTIWPRLLRIVRDERQSSSIRKESLFWVGQAAADRVAPERFNVNLEREPETADEAVRKQAVFALSQQKKDIAVPGLVEIARTNRHPEVRRAALFWLGQTGDPRAVSLFEEILSGRK